jgi:Uri superfamily endonuclease
VEPLTRGDFPAESGAYALVLRLDRIARLDITTLKSPSLAAGLYLYAGSAWGPGGIRARVGRHLRRDKAKRWHIDHLTAKAKIERVIALPGRRECDIVDFALSAPTAFAPIARFGASDCRTCPAHLLVVTPALVAALANRDSPTRPR